MADTAQEKGAAPGDAAPRRMDERLCFRLLKEVDEGATRKVCPFTGRPIARGPVR